MHQSLTFLKLYSAELPGVSMIVPDLGHGAHYFKMDTDEVMIALMKSISISHIWSM